MLTFAEHWQYLIDDYKKAKGNIDPELEKTFHFIFGMGALAVMSMTSEIATTIHPNKQDEKIKILFNEIKGFSKVGK